MSAASAPPSSTRYHSNRSANRTDRGRRGGLAERAEGRICRSFPRSRPIGRSSPAGSSVAGTSGDGSRSSSPATSSGSSSARRSATRPPRLWPTTTTGAAPSRRIASARTFAWSAFRSQRRPAADIEARRIDLEQPHVALQASFELREIAPDARSAARDENDGGERGFRLHFRDLNATVSQRRGFRRLVTKGWPEPDLAPDAHDRE